MLDGTKSQVKRHVARSASASVGQRQVRLSRQQRADLIRRYDAGAQQKELAQAYGIHVETVREILKRGGARPRTSLSPTQIERAAERYVAGDSLAAIARSLGVAANTVRTRLLAHGVTMRSTAGSRPPRRDQISANGEWEL